MKWTKRRLRNSTFFKSEELKTIKTDDPDRINLDVIVEEKPTGTISLGVGYSTYEKAMLTGGVSQQNILGTGNEAYPDRLPQLDSAPLQPDLHPALHFRPGLFDQLQHLQYGKDLQYVRL